MLLCPDQSGRGLPQSKTLARNSTAQAFSVATVFLKPLWPSVFMV